MKTSTGFSAITSIIKICFLVLVSGFSVNAQSITGKWKINSGKETITDALTGTKKDITYQLDAIIKNLDQVVEFRSDNSYVTSIKKRGTSAGFEVMGTYSISGNNLILTPGKSTGKVISNSKFVPNPLSSRLPGKMIIVSGEGSRLVLQYGSEQISKGKTVTVAVEESFQKQ
ncbi:MAG: hypothetical protein ABI741_01400 [Ferruginibacter sp.]